jgi:Na+-translocating ferredoxin:NAD+ oxidoreductase RnfG subunit
VPKRGWLDQFTGRALDGDLAVQRGIRGITGATLSSQAATDAVRRILAIHGAIP